VNGLSKDNSDEKTVIMLGIILVWVCSVWSQEPEIGWKENFDDPNRLRLTNFHVSHRYTAEVVVLKDNWDY